MRASVGIRLVGSFDLMEKASFCGALGLDDNAAEEGFSVPPVAALSFDVRPRRR